MKEVNKLWDHLHKNSNEVVICPTKVGYIICAISLEGLKKKFKLKGRPLEKPSVVLCSSTDQLFELADVEKAEADMSAKNPMEKGKPELVEYSNLFKKLIIKCDEQNLLNGFILPWREKAFAKLPKNIRDLMSSANTSCFVINHGKHSVELARLAREDNLLIFASSANISGRGNNGRFGGIGNQITDQVPVRIEDDQYVSSCQPNVDTNGIRAEQGVMVKLVGERPSIIRAGLSLPIIAGVMAEVFGREGGFNFVPGDYF